MTSEITVEPFFFGPSEGRLYGCYERPKATTRTTGILLCNPMGPEYWSTHRGLRQLASRLAQKGFPVLRFDYLGTGDSSGDSRHAGFMQMARDLFVALSELERRSRYTSVAVVGQRLGGSLILSTDFSREPLAGMVVWDPVVRGAELVEDILARSRSNSVKSGSSVSTDVEYKGFSWTASFREELTYVDVSAPAEASASRMLFVETAHNEALGPLCESHRARGSRVEHFVSESPRADIDEVDRIAVPAKAIHRIVGWMEAELP